MCYINSTLDLKLVGHVGDIFDNMTLGLWSDADWAGDRSDWRSTSGAFAAAIGKNTDFPLYARSKKQGSVSSSTPEAELIAAAYATRKIACPVLDLFDALRVKSNPCRVKLHEDNQACQQILLSGRNPTMPHLSRVHGINVHSMHEFWSRTYCSVVYERSHLQRADIFTKAFRVAGQWQHVCQLIGLCLSDDGSVTGAVEGNGQRSRSAKTVPPQTQLKDHHHQQKQNTNKKTDSMVGNQGSVVENVGA